MGGSLRKCQDVSGQQAFGKKIWTFEHEDFGHEYLLSNLLTDIMLSPKDLWKSNQLWISLRKIVTLDSLSEKTIICVWMNIYVFIHSKIIFIKIKNI